MAKVSRDEQCRRNVDGDGYSVYPNKKTWWLVLTSTMGLREPAAICDTHGEAMQVVRRLRDEGQTDVRAICAPRR